MCPQVIENIIKYQHLIMTNEAALVGIKDILNKLDEATLHGLTITVTQGLLRYKKKSRQEAIDVILKYSPDVISILRRRIITREILFTYLDDNNITIELPATKDKLIAKICKIWNLFQNESNINNKEIKDNIKTVNEETTSIVSGNNIDVMAQTFSQWFYKIMNSNECIDPDHFYPDAHLKLSFISSSTEIIEETETANCIAKVLFKIKTEHNLYFNPNLSIDGVQGKLDPHGLVMVLTCGTLHSNNSCVGIFEQMFALARDPFCENNWKIKKTELNLRSKKVTGIPVLSNCSLASKLLVSLNS